LKLGLTEVPVHVAVGLTPAQPRAYRIADNQTATLSQWDEDKLPLELAALQEAGFDLDLTGFSGNDLLRLLAPWPRRPPGRVTPPGRASRRNAPDAAVSLALPCDLHRNSLTTWLPR
jgi:hypothetical protein